MKLLEVVGGGCRLEWLVPKPVDNVFNMIDELVVFFAWVCVIESKVCIAAILLCKSEIEAD